MKRVKTTFLKTSCSMKRKETASAKPSLHSDGLADGFSLAHLLLDPNYPYRVLIKKVTMIETPRLVLSRQAPTDVIIVLCLITLISHSALSDSTGMSIQDILHIETYSSLVYNQRLPHFPFC
jgi:hypothetical protein